MGDLLTGMGDSRLLLDIFRCRSEEFSAQERYLLARLVLLDDESLGLTVKELSDAVGMSSSSFINARNRLSEKQLINIRQVPVKSSESQLGLQLRGRPRKGIGINLERLRSYLSIGRVEPLGPVEERVGLIVTGIIEFQLNVKLALPTSHGDEMSPNASVRPESRVLLSVLWVHAAESGVVTGLGRKELALLSGLRVGQVALQVQKLIEQGYIRHWVPGMTCKGLFGVGSGVLFLNPAPIEAVGLGRPVTTYVQSDVLSGLRGLISKIHGVKAKLQILADMPSKDRKVGKGTPLYLSERGSLLTLLCSFHLDKESCTDEGLPDLLSGLPDEGALTDQTLEQGFLLDRVFLDGQVGKASRYLCARLMVYAGHLLTDLAKMGLQTQPTRDEVSNELVARITKEAIPGYLKLEEDQSEWIGRLLSGFALQLARDAWNAVERQRGDLNRFQRQVGVYQIIPQKGEVDFEVVFWSAHT